MQRLLKEPYGSMLTFQTLNKKTLTLTSLKIKRVGRPRYWWQYTTLQYMWMCIPHDFKMKFEGFKDLPPKFIDIFQHKRSLHRRILLSAVHGNIVTATLNALKPQKKPKRKPYKYNPNKKRKRKPRKQFRLSKRQQEARSSTYRGSTHFQAGNNIHMDE